jgi:hypothetical protein
VPLLIIVQYIIVAKDICGESVRIKKRFFLKNVDAAGDVFVTNTTARCMCTEIVKLFRFLLSPCIMEGVVT